MIVKCVYCPRPHIFGIKEPFLNFSVTHGLCDAASARMDAEQDAVDTAAAAARPAPIAERLNNVLLAELSAIVAVPEDGYLLAPEVLEDDLRRVADVVKAAFEQRLSGKGTLWALAEAVDKLRGRAPSGAEVKS